MQTILRDALISFPMFGDFTINPPSTFVSSAAVSAR